MEFAAQLDLRRYGYPDTNAASTSFDLIKSGIVVHIGEIADSGYHIERISLRQSRWETCMGSHAITCFDESKVLP